MNQTFFNKKQYRSLITTISNSILTATIHPKGAELISLQTTASKREYIWNGDPAFWGKHSPILFPIVGTLRNNSYRYNDQTYTLSRHGFARDLVFQIKSQASDKVVFSLQADAVTQQLYPFPFVLEVTYALDNAVLTISYTVINEGKETMPYAIGGHPAFALSKPFTDYSLQFEADDALSCYLLDADLLSEQQLELPLIAKRLPLSYSLFENDALIFKSLQSKYIQLCEQHTPILNFGFEGFPHFGIWTKQDAPFLCLEPWAGYSDTVNADGFIMHKEGIQFLERNAYKAYHFTIEII